jgi:hypothetical protein
VRAPRARPCDGDAGAAATLAGQHWTVALDQLQTALEAERRLLTLTKRRGRKNLLPPFWDDQILATMTVLRSAGYSQRVACKITGRLFRLLFPSWWGDEDVSEDRIRDRYRYKRDKLTKA